MQNSRTEAENIVIREYTPDCREIWDNFVLNSNNGTIFHLQQFLDYHKPGRFNFYHLMFYKGEELIAVMPGGLSQNDSVLWSPVGASYGSIVTKDIHFELCLNIVDSLLQYCRDKKIKDLYCIPPPLVYYLNYSQHIEYAMLYRKFDFELHYISHAIDLKHQSNFLEYFDKTARKTIHKILREKKLSIVECDDIATFNEILLNNKAKHGAKPTHTLEEMIKLKELLPEQIKLFLVYYDGKAIAGSLLFVCNPKVVLCFYNMLLYEYEHLKPVYLIMYETCRWAIENKFEWVDIGVSQDTQAEDPMTPSLNLIQFKERFDSKGILRSTYHYKFSD